MAPITRMLVSVGLVICLISTSFLFLGVKTVLAESNYTFGSENVVKGSSENPANKNAEDATYNDLIEGDQYPNTNFSASNENVVTGTAGGDAFPSSLDTSDDSRRSYTEEDTGEEPPANYMVFLYPTSDSSVNWDAVFPSGDHYAQVDETTEGGDGGTTYVETATASDIDIFGMADLGNPGTGYTLDVYVFAVHYKGASQPCNFEVGLRIDSTNYQGYSVNPSNGVYTNQSSTIWTVNPDTTSEWTWGDIDAVQTYITTSDAAPDVRCTQVGIAVYVNFSAATNYELDAQITYSSVGGSAQTTGWKVLLEGFRSGSENFDVSAWDYDLETWNSKTTIQDGSDTVYDFDLTADEYDADGDEVKIRIVGLTESGDSTQDVVYLDVLKVSRIELGFASEVELTSTTVPAYGNITLRIKGYVSAETWQVDVWNYSSSGYDTNLLQITSLSNAWQTTIDLHDTHHRSGTTSKIRLLDTTAASADTTQDRLYLDVAWITHYYTDPEISDYRTGNIEIEFGQDVVVWLTYLDYDNQAPTYVRAHTNASYVAMDANDSDTDYFDGKLYGKAISGLAVGWYYYYFAVADAESGEITTETTSWTITVTAPSNTPANFLTSGITQWQNGTNYQYNAQVEDADSDPITWDLEGNGTSFLTDTPNGYFCLISGVLPTMGWWYVNISADDDGDSIDVTWQNFTLTALNTAPTFDNEAITTCFNNTPYAWAPNATDINSDTLIYSIDDSPSETLEWLTYNVSTGYIEGTPTVLGDYDVNLSVFDGLAHTWYNFTITVDLDDTETISVLALIIALIFCFGLLGLGLKEKSLWILAGPAWIFSGLGVFMPYGEAFAVMAIGLGIMLLIRGAYDVFT